MDIRVHFYSWFKDMTHCDDVVVAVSSGATIADLKAAVFEKFPKLSAVQNSMLVAVGVDYQTADYVLNEGDEVSLFPPVQGG
ncbi:MAG: molybdopterin synthase sulfur carrier subunit [Verrucomicrobiales bacterium]|nr:molybdopterin synthase sulfur carrier subunit [Verrucomicrobiales bacterium]